MARGRPFEKGHSVRSPRNLPMDPMLKKSQQITRAYGNAIIDKYSFTTFGELQKKLADPEKIPCLELLFMRFMNKAIVEGDRQSIEMIFNVRIGKPKETKDETRTISFNYAMGKKEEIITTSTVTKEEPDGQS